MTGKQKYWPFKAEKVEFLKRDKNLKSKFFKCKTTAIERRQACVTPACC